MNELFRPSPLALPIVESMHSVQHNSGLVTRNWVGLNFDRTTVRSRKYYYTYSDLFYSPAKEFIPLADKLTCYEPDIKSVVNSFDFGGGITYSVKDLGSEVSIGVYAKVKRINGEKDLVLALEESYHTKLDLQSRGVFLQRVADQEIIAKPYFYFESDVLANVVAQSYGSQVTGSKLVEVNIDSNSPDNNKVVVFTQSPELPMDYLGQLNTSLSKSILNLSLHNSLSLQCPGYNRANSIYSLYAFGRYEKDELVRIDTLSNIL